MYAQTAEGQVDAMAANEVATHVNLQQKQDSPHLCKLLGGFEVQDDAGSGREQASRHSGEVCECVLKVL